MGIFPQRAAPEVERTVQDIVVPCCIYCRQFGYRWKCRTRPASRSGAVRGVRRSPQRIPELRLAYGEYGMY